MILSEQDVQLLMHEKSQPHVRAAVAGKVANVLAIANSEMSPHEMKLAQDIIKVMVRDISIEVRQALSENLKTSDQLPRDVAIKLAQDVDSVALPILQYSAVLRDEDLILVIEGGSSAKQTAIAKREKLSANVSTALVDKGSEEAVVTLLSNRGATITDHTMQRMLNRFPESESVHDSMIHRDSLPLLVAERLVSMVSDNLRDFLVARHDLSPETVSTIIMQNREKAVIGLSARANTEGYDIERLVGQMNANGRLTPTLILRALCVGDINFFESAIAVKANIPLVNARLLIHDAGRLGLKSIFDKSGMPVRLMPAMRIALDVLKETEYDGNAFDLERFRNRVIERVLTQCEDLPDEDVTYLIGKIESMSQMRA